MPLDVALVLLSAKIFVSFKLSRVTPWCKTSFMNFLQDDYIHTANVKACLWKGFENHTEQKSISINSLPGEFLKGEHNA